MNRHLVIKMSCFCVLELRNSPAHALMPALGRLESEHFNHNLFDPDLIRGSLVDNYGWVELGVRIDIRCFNKDPSLKSSLKFLRKNEWARNKVEKLYLNQQKLDQPKDDQPSDKFKWKGID